MHKIRYIFLAATLVLLASQSAFAFDYATAAAATTNSGDNYKVTVTNLGNADNGSSETDNNRATFTNSTLFDSARATVRFTFPSYTAASGTNNVFLVLDNSVTGTVKARVWRVNGVDNVGSIVTLSGSSLSDQLFKLPFSLSSSTTITTIDIRFLMQSQNSTFDLEAVATPEPATFVLFGAGLLGLGAWQRRRRMKKKTA